MKHRYPCLECRGWDSFFARKRTVCGQAGELVRSRWPRPCARWRKWRTIREVGQGGTQNSEKMVKVESRRRRDDHDVQAGRSLARFSRALLSQPPSPSLFSYISPSSSLAASIAPQPQKARRVDPPASAIDVVLRLALGPCGTSLALYFLKTSQMHVAIVCTPGSLSKLVIAVTVEQLFPTDN